MTLNFFETIKAVKAVDCIYNNESLDLNKKNIYNISTDSREIPLNSIFFAIKGDKFDGHDFITQAVENGALGIVMKKEYANAAKQFGLHLKNNLVIIMVEETTQAFLDLAKYYKSLYNLNKVIAITGSVGKTTTKEFIYAVISEKYKTHKNKENYNNEIGLPLTLFDLIGETEAAVLEMGMSAFGEISRLTKAANPDIAVITNIGTSHIENLGSREGIKKAKLEILEGMNCKSTIILNADEPLLYAEKGRTGRHEYFYGINNKDADFIAENIKCDYKSYVSDVEIRVKESGEVKRFTIPVVGIHNIYNALPAVIIGITCGLTDNQIQNGLSNFENAKMRQNIYGFRDITIIDDCYNASLESMAAELNVLCENAKSKNGRKIAVLSDVLESGEYANEIHSKIGAAIEEKDIDMVFLYGENSKIIHDRIKKSCKSFYFTDKNEISAALFQEIKRGDTVLFKASRGMALETVLDDFKNRF